MEHAPQAPVPVFPLPGLVLFPGVVVPLHIFELRYRAMIRDALRGERFLVLALLEPGWEGDDYGSPAFHALGCLARIQQVEWLPNDCYDLRAEGLSRVRIGRRVREYPYRTASVELLPQAPLTEDDPLVKSERVTLLEAFTRLARSTGAPPALRDDLPFEPLVNHVCMSLEVDPASRLQLLALDDVVERSRLARELMARSARAHGGQPGEHN